MRYFIIIFSLMVSTATATDIKTETLDLLNGTWVPIIGGEAFTIKNNKILYKDSIIDDYNYDNDFNRLHFSIGNFFLGKDEVTIVFKNNFKLGRDSYGSTYINQGFIDDVRSSCERAILKETPRTIKHEEDWVEKKQKAREKQNPQEKTWIPNISFEESLHLPIGVEPLTPFEESAALFDPYTELCINKSYDPSTKYLNPLFYCMLHRTDKDIMHTCKEVLNELSTTIEGLGYWEYNILLLVNDKFN